MVQVKAVFWPIPFRSFHHSIHFCSKPLFSFHRELFHQKEQFKRSRNSFYVKVWPWNGAGMERSTTVRQLYHSRTVLWNRTTKPVLLTCDNQKQKKSSLQPEPNPNFLNTQWPTCTLEPHITCFIAIAGCIWIYLCHAVIFY